MARTNVAGVAPQCEMIELQFDESPLFDALLPCLHPVLNRDAFEIPLLPGMQADVQALLFQRHPYAAVALGVETLAMGLPDQVAPPPATTLETLTS